MILNLTFFVSLKCQQLLSSTFFFSGVQESKSEVIDISNLSGQEQRNVRLAFLRSGFADERSGKYNLRPCSLGAFADSSLTDPNCKNCSAGKLQLFIPIHTGKVPGIITGTDYITILLKFHIQFTWEWKIKYIIIINLH